VVVDFGSEQSQVVWLINLRGDYSLLKHRKTVFATLKSSIEELIQI
jgi:hypothetical protein